MDMEFVVTILVIVVFLQSLVNPFSVYVNRNLDNENFILREELYYSNNGRGNDV